MPLYIKETLISPLYNGEVKASVYKETEISQLYNGEVKASVYKRDWDFAIVQRRSECLCI